MFELLMRLLEYRIEYPHPKKCHFCASSQHFRIEAWRDDKWKVVAFCPQGHTEDFWLLSEDVLTLLTE